jgi:hypothetical protein
MLWHSKEYVCIPKNQRPAAGTLIFYSAAKRLSLKWHGF